MCGMSPEARRISIEGYRRMSPAEMHVQELLERALAEAASH